LVILTNLARTWGDKPTLSCERIHLSHLTWGGEGGQTFILTWGDEPLSWLEGMNHDPLTREDKYSPSHEGIQAFSPHLRPEEWTVTLTSHLRGWTITLTWGDKPSPSPKGWTFTLTWGDQPLPSPKGWTFTLIWGDKPSPSPKGWTFRGDKPLPSPKGWTFSHSPSPEAINLHPRLREGDETLRINLGVNWQHFCARIQHAASKNQNPLTFSWKAP